MKGLERDFHRHAERNEAAVGVCHVTCVFKEIRYVNMKLCCLNTNSYKNSLF